MVNNGIVVFISGRGSNLNAIINAVNDGVIKYPITAVVSDRYCEGIEISRKNKLNTLIIDHRKFKSKLSFEKEIIKKIKPLNPNLIVLAGFMQILSISFIKEFKSKLPILNIGTKDEISPPNFAISLTSEEATKCWFSEAVRKTVSRSPLRLALVRILPPPLAGIMRS